MAACAGTVQGGCHAECELDGAHPGRGVGAERVFGGPERATAWAGAGGRFPRCGQPMSACRAGRSGGGAGGTGRGRSGLSARCQARGRRSRDEPGARGGPAWGLVGLCSAGCADRATRAATTGGAVGRQSGVGTVRVPVARGRTRMGLGSAGVGVRPDAAIEPQRHVSPRAMSYGVRAPHPIPPPRWGEGGALRGRHRQGVAEGPVRLC